MESRYSVIGEGIIYEKTWRPAEFRWFENIRKPIRITCIPAPVIIDRI